MYKRILTIQDVSCVGQCSGTVAMPIISACGHETCVLPSAVLSTHTYNFNGFTFRDLAGDFPGIIKHWQDMGIKFDAVYTGYLGSVEQIDYVLEIMSTCLKDGGLRIVDPAMGDHGKLYPNFGPEYASEMKKLCAVADIVIPNITEAAILCDTEYHEMADEMYVIDLLASLVELGAKSVVLTGVSTREGSTGAAIYDASKAKIEYYEHEKLPQDYHGTGDIFASVFTGKYMSGESIFDAAAAACDFVVDAIKNTVGDDEHWYGVKFEPLLKEL